MSTATAWSRGRAFACNCLKSAEIHPVGALEMQCLPWTKWKSKIWHMHTPPEAPVNTDISAWLRSCGWWFWNQPTGMQMQSSLPARRLQRVLGSCGHMFQVRPQELLGRRNQTRVLIYLPLAVLPWGPLNPPSLGFPICQVRLRTCLSQMGLERFNDMMLMNWLYKPESTIQMKHHIGSRAQFERWLKLSLRAEIKLLWAQILFHHILTLWPWADDGTSPCLRLLICKMEKIISPTTKTVVKIKWNDSWKALIA